jgi:hypothetical protein
MSEYMVEIRPSTVRRGKLKLVPLEERFKHIGFTSVYAFPSEVAGRALEIGNTRGLAGCAVYSDTLFVDFDDNEEAADRFRDFLVSSNVSFGRYHSGGRSIHFHVEIEPMLGVNVPYSQRSWIEDYAPNADTAIYTHAGMYRLPGTYHAKNPGRKKIQLEQHHGYPLHIPSKPRLDIGLVEADRNYRRFLGILLCQTAYEGGRQIHSYKICAAGRTAGMTQEEVEELLLAWNESHCVPPREEYELKSQLERVFA